MTSEQKLMALPVLDAIGLDVIEFGMVTDDAAADLFSRAAQLAPQSCVSALSRLRQDEVARTVKALRRFSRSKINLLCVGSEIHLRDKLKVSKEMLEAWVSGAINTTRAHGHAGETLAILEDASRGSREWLNTQICLLRRLGVKQVCFADTVGCLTPLQVGHLFQWLRELHPDITFSGHFHNDLGLATANSLAAIDAGIDEVQVTFGGIGERCGNAAIEEIIAVLGQSPAYRDRYRSRLSLRSAVETCDAIYAIHGARPHEKKPLIGEHAFATCAGIHQDGILKAPHVYEMLDPTSIGRQRAFHINRLSSAKVRREDTAAA